jgi:transposase InsO family protein
LGSGINNLYDKVSRSYIGITRKDVTTWLRSNINYQIATKPPKQTNKKIHSSGINKILAADLIDLNPYVAKNRQYRYMLVVVDVFSKYVLLSKLKNKEPRSIIDGFREIFRFNANQNFPIKSLLTDNGTEFKNQLMKEFVIEQGFKQIFGLSHSPISNALVEQTNGLIRRLFSFLFVEQGNIKWFDSLDRIANSINHSIPDGYNYSRKSIYFDENRQGEHNALEMEREKHKRDLRKTKAEQFHIGDRVRIAQTRLYSEVRAKIKEGNQKLINAYFDIHVYTVFRVNKSKSKFLRDSYSLMDEADGAPLTGVYYSNQLRKVPLDTTENNNLTNRNIRMINDLTARPVVRRRRNDDDDEYVDER